MFANYLDLQREYLGFVYASYVKVSLVISRVIQEYSTSERADTRIKKDGHPEY